MDVTFDYFEMPVNSSLQNTHAVQYQEGRFVVTRPEYNAGRLLAQDVVGAKDELYGIVTETDIPYDTCFWYTLTDHAGNTYCFRILEITPGHIFIKGADNQGEPVLVYGAVHPPTAEFLSRIRQSGLCSDVELTDDHKVHVTFTSEVTESAYGRSVAHETILKLFPGKS